MIWASNSFRVRAGFGLELVSPFTTLIKRLRFALNIVKTIRAAAAQTLISNSIVNSDHPVASKTFEADLVFFFYGGCVTLKFKNL